MQHLSVHKPECCAAGAAAGHCELHSGRAVQWQICTVVMNKDRNNTCSLCCQPELIGCWLSTAWMSYRTCNSGKVRAVAYL